MQTNKQIVDKFSKENGIKDPIVDTFIAMQDEMPDLGHYSVLGSRHIDTTYGVDPGFYEDHVSGLWAEYFNKAVNPNTYYDGDWKHAEWDKCYKKLPSFVPMIWDE